MSAAQSHRLPNFIIAGAPRSATTWLHALASSHPNIAMPQPVFPEPKFFLVDELYGRGLDYYSERWFDTLPVGRVLGEKSTNYLESPLVAARIHGNIPGAKLVFMLRNPIDRAHSNYLWSKQNGLEKTETFEEALAAEDARESSYEPALRFARPFSFYSRGLYADLLGRFFDLFQREQILVLRTEDIAFDAHELARTFFNFVGVEPLPKLADNLGLINAVEDKITVLPAHVRAALVNRYREPNRKLAELLGPDFKLWDEWQ